MCHGQPASRMPPFAPYPYVGRSVSVTQRVANESAVTADALQQLLQTSP